MEFRPCPAPYRRYEVSKFGDVRRKTATRGYSYRTPVLTKHGAYIFSLMRDRGKSTTVTAKKLIRMAWPDQPFRASPQWLVEVRDRARAWNSDDGDVDGLLTGTERVFDYSDFTPKWNDANFCPLG